MYELRCWPAKPTVCVETCATHTSASNVEHMGVSCHAASAHSDAGADQRFPVTRQGPVHTELQVEAGMLGLDGISTRA
jgi:hypothetical protein